jgi:hypothetical protein
MSATIVSPGGLARQDTNDKRVYQFDWDAENLPSGVHIATSTFTVTVRRPSGATTLSKDNEGIVGGAGVGRKTTLRLYGGQLDGLYEVANKIVTDESPAQTKERSFLVLVQNL